jgi:hypothetical protein
MSRVTVKGHDRETQCQAVAVCYNVFSRYFFFPGGREKKHETLCQDNKVPSHSANQYPSDTLPSVCVCVCVCLGLFITIYEFAVHMRNTCNSMYITTAPVCSTCHLLIVMAGCYDSHLFTLRQHRFTNHAQPSILHDQETHT